MPIMPNTLSTSDRRGHAKIDRPEAPSSTGGVLVLGGRALLLVVFRALRVAWDFRWEISPLLALSVIVQLVPVLTGSEALAVHIVGWVAGLAVGYVLARRFWSRSAREEHQAHRALIRFRRTWPDHALSLGLTRQDKRGEPVAPKIKSAENLGGGSFRWTLDLPRGMTTADIEHQAEELAGAYCASSVMADRDSHNASRCLLTVVGQNDPLFGDPLPATPLTSLQPGLDPDTPVVLGYTSTGEPATIKLKNASVLLGGSPGAGKSVGLSGVLSTLVMMRDTELWLCDPKRVEFKPWRACADRLALDLEEAAQLIDALVDEMDRRYRYMEEEGLRYLPPSSEWPRLVLVVDELAELTASGVSKESKAASTHFAEQLRRLVAKGRACSVVPVLATQKCDSTVCPTGIRDLIAIRLAYRCGSEAQAITILGDEAVKVQGATAHAIAKPDEGVGFLVGETGNRATRLRSYWLTDDDVERIATRAAEWRNDLVPVGSPRPDGSFATEPRAPAIPACVDHRNGGGQYCPGCLALWQEHMIRDFLGSPWGNG